MIDLPAELIAILSKPHTTAHMLSIELSPVLNLTNAGAHINHGGIEYRAGYWKNNASIEQQSSPKIGEVKLELASVDSTITALFFTQNWLNVPVTISKAWFNDAGQVAFKVVVWRGMLSGKEGEEGKNEAKLTLKAASIWADFSASRGRKTNLKSQQLFQPYCRGMEFSGTIITDIPWGRAGTPPPVSGGKRNDRGPTHRQYEK